MLALNVKRTSRDLLFSFLDSRGYMIKQLTEPEMASLRDFERRAAEITARHWQQDETTVQDLRAKYQRGPMLGKGRMFDFIRQLSLCIDPLEVRFGCTSQLTHILQVLEGMERDGVEDPDLLLAGLVHDIGKLLLLVGEAPEYIESNGLKTPLGDPPRGIGLMNCTFRWDHCDFAYIRLKGHVPEHIAWLLRHHGIHPVKCQPYMNDSDRTYMQRYYNVFAKFDDETKSSFRIPQVRLDRYRPLLEQAFPNEIEL